jgi:hypothetical protein
LEKMAFATAIAPEDGGSGIVGFNHNREIASDSSGVSGIMDRQ